jgi:O-antigen/teichoic acid export membrane protein
MTATDNRVRRLLRNASKLLAADAVASLIGLLQAIILARAIGAAGYGLLSLVIVFADIFNQLVDVRLWETVTKFVGEFHERGQHGHARATIKVVYLLDLTTGILAFLLVLVIAPLAAERLFHRAEAAPLMIVFSLTLLVSTVNQTSMALLRVFDRFTALGAERVGFVAVRCAALAVAALATRSLGPIVWTYVAVDAVRATVLLVLGLRASAHALTDPGDDRMGLLRPRLRELVTFSLHNSLSMLLSLVTRQLDVLILAALRGDREVGYFRMAKNFARLLLRVSDPVYHAIYPELVRLREQTGDLGIMRRFIGQTMRRVMLVVVPAAVTIALGAPIIIDRLVGSEFAPAVPALRIMVAGVLVNAAFLWARPLALTAGRPQASTAAFAVGTVVLGAGSLLLVPPYGYLGSAITYSLTMATTAVLMATWAVRAARPTPPPRAS